MMLKTFFVVLTFFTVLKSEAAIKNLCDDLIAAGKSSEDQIQKCLNKFGESDTYKENIQKKKMEKEAARIKAMSDQKEISEEASRKANIESKKFSVLDLDEAGFGKPFIAFRIDYSDRYKPKEKRITEGDALCKYLGYEKAFKSMVSAEIMPKVINKNGLVINTNFLGIVSKEPDVYFDKDEKYTVRRYLEITCARVKSKDIAGTAEQLSKVAEDLIVLNTALNSSRKESKNPNVFDEPRKPSENGQTENSYKKPDWATDLPGNATSK